MPLKTHNMLRIAIWMIPVFVASLGAAWAQEPSELVTDRPDQTESAVTVDPGKVQLELGFTFIRDDEEGLRREAQEAGGTLIRLGLRRGLELRIGFVGWVREELAVTGGDLVTDGAGDAELGVKILLREEQGSAPQMALLASTSVPLGERAFTTDRFDPALRLAFSHTLSDRLGLGYNVGISWATELDLEGDLDTLASPFYTLALGIGLSSRWGAFVELFGEFPSQAGEDARHSFNGGLTFLVADHVQLDLAGGLGLSEVADDAFLGVGLSMRWPR